MLCNLLKLSFFVKNLSSDASIKSVNINNTNSILDHMYIETVNSRLWPDIKYIELFRMDIKNGKETCGEVLY
ncbi:MAG: DUF4833 domain-containing protein [Bacteroidales bacterium]|nr:DUF4833 domain-containing protein [Bacteroidales bacterium]